MPLGKTRRGTFAQCVEQRKRDCDCGNGDGREGDRPETREEIMSKGTIADMPDSLRGGKLTGGDGGNGHDGGDDDGYDGPLDFDVTAREAGIGGYPESPDLGPDSWLNTTTPIMTARLEITGVLMETGEINLGNGHIYPGWPETFNVSGVGTLTRQFVNRDDDEATSTAVYAITR